MISTSLYRRKIFVATGVLVKHCRIPYRSQGKLSKLGCNHLHSSDNILSRNAPLNSIKMLRADETCCIRVRCSIQVPGAILSFKWMCAQAINQLYQFLTTRQKEQYVWCRIGLYLRTGLLFCSELVKNGMREVACA